MRRLHPLIVAASLIGPALFAGPAFGAAPLAGLTGASCASKSAGTGLPYVFCDDGVPDQGGRTPNTTGAKAVLVPATYAGTAGLPAAKPDPACGTPGAAVGGSAPDPAAPSRCDVALDVDISKPAGMPPPGGWPLLVLMHGCCSGNKTSWEAASVDAGGEKWHYNNAWFASRGYVVVTYTSRGFVSGSGKGSTGETQIDSLPYEMNDFQQLAGYVADDPSLHVDPSRVVATGGSYGGGFAWLALTDPFWTSPGGKPMRLAAVAPKYGWTDLAYSLVPTGDHLQEPGRLPAFDGSGTGVGAAPAGIPKQSILTALYGSGMAAATDHATFPSSITQIFACLQAGWPPESNPLCAGPSESVLADFVSERSAYYQDGTHGAVDFFGRLARNPGYRIPVFDAATFTDPLFTDVENRRMVDRLEAASPDYPIEQYYGDYQHFVQNKDRTWGDECGADHHVCRQADYAGGHLDATPASRVRTGATTRLNRFVDHYARPPLAAAAPAPAHDVTAELQVCSPTGGATTEPGEQFTAPSFEALTKGGLSLSFAGAQTTSTPTGDSHAVAADPVGNLASNGGACPVAASRAGSTVASYEGPALPSPATMLGAGEVTAKYAATGGPGFQLDARLYDVAPDGSALLVDRGPKRLTAASGTTSYELHGNGWRFAAGHKVRLELAADDAPYLKAPSSPSSIAVSSARLLLPIRETTYGTAKPGASGSAKDHSAPRAALTAPALASTAATTRRVPLRWRGSDIGSGISAFRVQARRARTKTWRTIAVGRATSSRFRAAAGITYALRVRAKDKAGNVGRWSRESVMTVPRDERVKGLRRRGPWTRPKLKGSWYGRAYRCASKRCAIRFRYTGATFTLVAPRGPHSGRLLVKVDRTKRIVNLHAKRYGARKAVVRIARTRRRHRVYLRVLSGRAAIDAYGLR